MAADARAAFAGAHIEPRHLVQLGAALGIHGLERQRHVGRHFDAERAVRRQRHRAEFDSLVAHVNDVRVRGARGQRHRAEHANGPDAFPARLALGGEAGVLAKQKTRGARFVGAGAIHVIGNHRWTSARAQENRRVYAARLGLEERHHQIVARVDDAERVRSHPLPVRAQHGAEEPSVGERREVAELAGQSMLFALRTAGGADEIAVAGNVGQAPVRQRRGAAEAKGAQAHAVVGADVRGELGETIRAVGPDAVQVRLDLAAVEEIVGADEGDAAVGHHLGLVVEDRRGRDEMNVAAVGVHPKERAGWRLMIFLEGADARGRENNPAIRQFGGVDVVERAVGETLRWRAVEWHAVKVEELLATQRGGDEQRASIEGRARRAEHPTAGVEEEAEVRNVMAVRVGSLTRPHPGPLPQGEGECGGARGGIGRAPCYRRLLLIHGRARRYIWSVRPARARRAFLPLLGERVGVTAAVPLGYSGLPCERVKLSPNLGRTRQVKLRVSPRPVADTKGHAPGVGAKRHIHAAILAEKRHGLGPIEILIRLREIEPRSRQSLRPRPLASLGPRHASPWRQAHRPQHFRVAPLRPFDKFRMRVIDRLTLPRYAPGFIRDQLQRWPTFDLDSHGRDDAPHAAQIDAMNAEDVPALHEPGRDVVSLDRLPHLRGRARVAPDQRAIHAQFVAVVRGDEDARVGGRGVEGKDFAEFADRVGFRRPNPTGSFQRWQWLNVRRKQAGCECKNQRCRPFPALTWLLSLLMLSPHGSSRRTDCAINLRA